jgi:ring-1,2-phenylacetyl-CoA epoxidase subunit PaaD
VVSDLRARAWDAAARVVDPEIPVLTIADLGVLRDVRVEGGHVEVLITPTYSGCPAMRAIALDVAAALAEAGIADASVRTVLGPAWTTDWMSEEGRRKLREYGVAPPLPGTHPACPHCGSARTEMLSEFGSTACKALWRCRDCREPFDHFRCH